MNDLSDIFDCHKKSIVEFIDGVRNEAYQKGRADAIDEFLDKVSQFVAYSYTTLSYSDIERIAEELKEKK